MIKVSYCDGWNIGNAPAVHGFGEACTQGPISSGTASGQMDDHSLLREMLKDVLLGLEGEVLSSNCEHAESEGDPDKLATAFRLYALWERQERQGTPPCTHGLGPGRKSDPEPHKDGAAGTSIDAGPMCIDEKSGITYFDKDRSCLSCAKCGAWFIVGDCGSRVSLGFKKRGHGLCDTCIDLSRKKLKVRRSYWGWWAHMDKIFKNMEEDEDKEAL